MEKLDEMISELENAVGEQPAAAAAAAVSAEQNSAKSGRDAKKAEKAAEKAAKAAANPPAPPTAEAPKAELDVNAMDFRVGVIVSVHKHETADKLYCEMIDIGEPEPRAIASGLVHHYSLEEMQGRRLVVVANLAPRKLVGFKSHGMVLCAAKVLEDGKEKVEFVDPPLSARPGDRVVGLGLPLTAPLAPKQVDKQKAFELLAPGLNVSSGGVATWNGRALVVEGSGESCTAPTLRDCVIR